MSMNSPKSTETMAIPTLRERGGFESALGVRDLVSQDQRFAEVQRLGHTVMLRLLLGGFIEEIES